jgi:hypothetical protein
MSQPMAVATGDVCSDPLGLGAADIAQIQQTGSYKAGTVTLTDVNATLSAGGQTATGTSDTASGTFNSQTLDSFFASTAGPSFGSCMTSGIWTALGAPPAFRRTIPSGFAWTNEQAVNTVIRSQNLDITWSGADPAGGVLIVGVALDSQAGVALSFSCLERATAGHFTIPSFILLAAPVTPAAILTVQAVGPPVRFSTSGMDFGTFTYSTGFAKNISLAYSNAKI